MKDELLPCPFCGGEAELVCGEEIAAAQCLQVSAHRLILDGDNNIAEEVVKHWNRRAPRPFRAGQEDMRRRAAEVAGEYRAPADDVEGRIAALPILDKAEE